MELLTARRELESLPVEHVRKVKYSGREWGPALKFGAYKRKISSEPLLCKYA